MEKKSLEPYNKMVLDEAKTKIVFVWLVEDAPNISVSKTPLTDPEILERCEVWGSNSLLQLSYMFPEYSLLGAHAGGRVLQIRDNVWIYSRE